MLLRELTDAQAEELLWDWEAWARPEQLPPEGDWSVWAILAGRGAGKTRTGAEWTRAQIKAGVSRVALIAPTAADARDVMVLGESGLLSVCWEKDKTQDGHPLGKPRYEPSYRRVVWENGAQAILYSSEEPDRLRGPQHGALWGDELAAWKKGRAVWDMAMMGLRLGAFPRALVTTTPRAIDIVRELIADPTTVVTRGSTFDNAANLAPKFIRDVRRRYEGTRLGRQELFAEVLDDVPGALWTEAMFSRVEEPGVLVRVVVGVDPSGARSAHDEMSDGIGLIAAGLKPDGRYVVLEDATLRASPAEWAAEAVRLARRHQADRIVAEVNFGGAMVEAVIRSVWPDAPLTLVHASRGKAVRAEPIAALYEQGRVDHVGGLEELESQMTQMTRQGYVGVGSPDRVDALVWATTELQSGAGASRMHAVPLSSLMSEPTPLPAHWPRASGMVIDGPTVSAVWVAKRPEDAVVHVYAEHQATSSASAVHVEAIKARGSWVRGYADVRGRSKAEAALTLAPYRRAGIGLAVSATPGQPDPTPVDTLAQTGRLRVSTMMDRLVREDEGYARDHDGKATDMPHALMDALRLAVMAVERLGRVQPVEAKSGVRMPISKIGGY